MSDDDDEEEFDQLISGTPPSTKVVLKHCYWQQISPQDATQAVKKEKGSRKRDALEGGADSDSSASGPSSTSASAKKAKMGRPQLKTKTEEPSSTHRFVPDAPLYNFMRQFAVKGRDERVQCTLQP